MVISPDSRVQVTGGTKQWVTKLTNGQTDKSGYLASSKSESSCFAKYRGGRSATLFDCGWWFTECRFLASFGLPVWSTSEAEK